jgi:hypothetical protein
MNKNDMNLPNELVDFLKAGKQLKYDYSKCEVGKITLYSLNEIKIGEVYIELGEYGSAYYKETSFYKDDPNKGKQGYYIIPAVSITSDRNEYEVDTILLWFPLEGKFGTWDGDHYELYIFPNATWDDIVKNPAPYINAQWEVDSEVSEYFKPYPKYQFKHGEPFD